MNDPKAIVVRILDIIGYSEDKEKFAGEFLQTMSAQTLLDLFNSLPQDKKDQVKEQMTNTGNNPQAIQDILKTYFSESQIQDGLQNASKNAVAEYIKTIDPTLSETQRDNLVNLSKELNQNNTPDQSAS